MIEGANWRDKDRLIVARAQAREIKRLADEKTKAETAASSKRAADAVAEVVKRDAATSEENKQTEPGGPPVALTVPPLLTASQLPMAEGYDPVAVRTACVQRLARPDPAPSRPFSRT